MSCSVVHFRLQGLVGQQKFEGGKLMQVGNLVRLKNTVTGDGSNMVRLYRDKVPLLVLSQTTSHWQRSLVTLLDATRPGYSQRLQIDEHRLEVVSSCK